MAELSLNATLGLAHRTMATAVGERLRLPRAVAKQHDRVAADAAGKRLIAELVGPDADTPGIAKQHSRPPAISLMGFQRHTCRIALCGATPLPRNRYLLDVCPCPPFHRGPHWVKLRRIVPAEALQDYPQQRKCSRTCRHSRSVPMAVMRGRISASRTSIPDPMVGLPEVAETGSRDETAGRGAIDGSYPSAAVVSPAAVRLPSNPPYPSLPRTG